MADKIAAQATFYNDQVDFWIFDWRDGRKRVVARNIEYEEFPEGGPTPPSVSIPFDAAQELFEQLWAQGFRSKHDKGNAAALDAARQEHIGDLRRAAKLDRADGR